MSTPGHKIKSVTMMHSQPNAHPSTTGSAESESQPDSACSGIHINCGYKPCTQERWSSSQTQDAVPDKAVACHVASSYLLRHRHPSESSQEALIALTPWHNAEVSILKGRQYTDSLACTVAASQATESWSSSPSMYMDKYRPFHYRSSHARDCLHGT